MERNTWSRAGRRRFRTREVWFFEKNLRPRSEAMTADKQNIHAEKEERNHVQNLSGGR